MLLHLDILRTYGDDLYLFQPVFKGLTENRRIDIVE